MLSKIARFFMGSSTMFYALLTTMLIAGAASVAANYAQKAQIKYYREQNTTLITEYSDLSNAYEITVQEARRLVHLRELDSQVIMSLHELLKQNMDATNESQQKQDDVERSQPGVKSYLDSPVDPDIKRLLDSEDSN